MQIAINDHRKILSIQEEFSLSFPFLKIGFFAKPSSPLAPASKKLVKNSQTLIKCMVPKDGTIEIAPSMTITALEESFKSGYGLTIEVQQKSGMNFIKLNSLDSLSLEEENEKARLLN